jgi:hypothetical protein
MCDHILCSYNINPNRHFLVMKLLGALLFGVIVLILLTGLILCLTGCRTIKEVTKTVTLIDSSSVAERDSLTQVVAEMKVKHESELRESQYASVIFDTIRLAGDTVINKIIIREDGSIEAVGRIKAANVSKEKMARLYNELQVRYDSLTHVKNKVETKVVTSTVTKEKKIKRGLGLGWSILLLVIAFCLRKGSLSSFNV